MLSYVVTGKATFLVTGDKSRPGASARGKRRGLRTILGELHPDQGMVQGFELVIGLVFMAASVFFFQPTTLGLAVGFLLLPLMHRVGWEHGAAQALLYVPLAFIVLGLSLGGMGLFGAKTVMFGYGFHF